MAAPELPILAVGRKPPSTSRWVEVLDGRITAAGCPSRGRLAQWRQNGATDVVTLQREDERPAWLPTECAAVGLGWRSIPLSGRRLEGPEDRNSLARIPALLELLRETPARSLVVHCAAGMHRTGLCLYVVMRRAGLGPGQALERVAQARAVTAEELHRSTRRGGRLADRAEEVVAWLRAESS